MKKQYSAANAEFEEVRRRVVEIFEELEHAGEIYDTGLRRNGYVVYEVTPKLKSRH